MFREHFNPDSIRENLILIWKQNGIISRYIAMLFNAINAEIKSGSNNQSRFNRKLQIYIFCFLLLDLISLKLSYILAFLRKISNYEVCIL